MKKRTKQIFSVFMTGMLLTGMIAGCGKAASQEEQELTEENFQEVSLEDGNSWETDTTPITIEWFVCYDWFGKTFSPDTNLADAKILEDTGITIEFTSGDLDKLNLLITTGDLPDVITMDITASQRLTLEDNGLLYPLDELSEKYAPDLNVPESMAEWYQNDDGHWYTLASYFTSDERCNSEFGGYRVTHNHNFVRTDLLEQIGGSMEDLQTKEGFLNTLRKVKEANLTYDGQTVTPFVGHYTPYLAQQFGMCLEDEDGNLVNEKRTPEFLEALLFYNTLYREGLMTDEEFTMDSSQLETKIASGAVFAATGVPTVQTARESLYSYDSDALMLYCGQMSGDSGEEPEVLSVNSGGWTGTVITTNAEYPNRIIQLFSYLTTEEMTLDAQYGTDTYDVVDGSVVMRDEVVEEYSENYESAYAKYNLDMSFMVDWSIIQKYQEVPTDPLDEDELKMNTDPEVQIIDDKCFTDIDPEANTDLAGIQTKIENYWEQIEPEIIMADSAEECVQKYEEAIAQMDSMGMEELDEYQNERFQENKEKLGLERAWVVASE